MHLSTDRRQSPLMSQEQPKDDCLSIVYCLKHINAAISVRLENKYYFPGSNKENFKLLFAGRPEFRNYLKTDSVEFL